MEWKSKVGRQFYSFASQFKTCVLLSVFWGDEGGMGHTTDP